MKVYVFSDIHNTKIEYPTKVPDLVICLGDIPWQEIGKIDQLYGCPKFGVLGNHDLADTFRRTGFVDMHKQNYTLNGLTFSGFQGCPRYNAKSFGQHSEDEAEFFINRLDKVDVFLAHSNPVYRPVGHADGSHRGFYSMGRYIQQKQPTYFLHGHIHENYVEFQGKTKLISTYLFREIEI